MTSPRLTIEEVVSRVKDPGAILPKYWAVTLECFGWTAQQVADAAEAERIRREAIPVVVATDE